MNVFNILRSSLLFLLVFCLLLSASCIKPQPSDGPSAESGDQSGDQSSSQSVTPSPEQPDGPFEISLTDASGKAGDEITVSLDFKNNPSICGYSVTVVYDPQVLTFVKCENKIPGGFATSNSTVSGKVRVMCTVMGGNVLSQNGANDTLTFKIKEDAPIGESQLQLIIADKADDIFTIEDDKSMPTIPCTLTGATVTVVE